MIFTSAKFVSCQAEFATSAVDFLHRVGRTARAGQSGIVTNLFTESNRDLVAAVRQAEKMGLPVVMFLIRQHDKRGLFDPLCLPDYLGLI